MTRTRMVAAFLAVLLCAPLAAEKIPITLLHLNDVYELTPIQGEGGLARLATIRKRLQAKNPRTLMLLAGDVLSPSAAGTAVDENGRRFAGRQIVDVLNSIGLDYATFGNHEFDLAQADFLARLSESKFRWISGNVRDADGKPFPGVVDHEILALKGRRDSVRVGIVSVTIPSNPVPWVTYLDFFESARSAAETLRSETDVIIALTHLDIDDDARLAAEIPGIDLVIGGHEHDNYDVRRGRDFVPIRKADANARTVWVHQLVYDTKAGALTIDSRLVRVDASIPEDPAAAKLVDRWMSAATARFKLAGFDAPARVAVVPMALDGRGSAVYRAGTNLTVVIAEALLHEVRGADLSVFNAGSIRLDDVLSAGTITQYDVIRALPFGGNVDEVEMKGSLLAAVLDAGFANRGTGGFLHGANVSMNPGGEWLVGGVPVDSDRVYRVAMADFLLTGRERRLGFLTPQHPGVISVKPGRDVRNAVIDELARRWPAK